MSRVRFIVAAALVLTVVSLASAQTTQPIANAIHRSTNANTTAPAGLSSQQPLDTGRVLLALGAVLGLIFVLRFGIKRMMPGALGRPSRGVRVVGRTTLGPKQQVLVLQVGRRILIVGDSGQQLRTLSEISDPDEIAALLGQMQGNPASAAPAESFTAVMDRASEHFTPPPVADETGDPVLESARTELNGLADRVRILAKHLNRA